MKNRLVMIVLSILVILAAGAMVYAIYNNRSGREEFAEDGYIIVFDEKNAEQPAKTYHFTEGTTFKRTYEGSIQFRDTEGNTVTADSNSFVHYDSGASASLSKSVLVNLDEVESSAQNYYGLNSGTSVSRNGSSYMIDAADNSVDLSDYLWKVGDNRYMMVSDNILVSFSDGTTRDYEDYIELLYQEGGMVCIMHGDEVIRDASKNTYVTVDNGVSINLNTQMIVTENSEGTGKDVLMSLGQITTDSDQVVNVLPADEDKLKIVIPEFIFNVTDGKNGEAGADGENGSNGINGDSGADGINGESGRTGLMGYDGDNGEAGQAGTSGRSGTNGTEGAVGTDGAQGAAGPAGAQGSSGAAGGAGAAGSAGAAGPSGPSGSDGDTGNPGIPGVAGETVIINNPTDVLKELPVLFWEVAPVATYSEITGEFGFKTSIDERAPMSVRNVKATLLDVETGKVVYTQEVPGEMTTGANSEKVQLSGFDHLAPAHSYRLVITGEYDYKNQKVETTFFSTTLVTDDFPLMVNVYNVEANKIDIELINRDADADPTTQNVTHNFSIAYDLIDALGNVVSSSLNYPISTNIGAATNPTIVNADRTTSDHLIVDSYQSGSGAIKSDSMYYFSITSLDSNSSNIPSRYVKIPIRTLKTVPTIANAIVLANIANHSFDLSVASVYDPDHAIKRYRYEIRNSLGELVKTVYAPDSDVVHCYIDGKYINSDGTFTDVTGTGLTADEYYTVRAIAEAYDNVKNIEAVCDFGDQVTMNGVTQYTWFTLDNKASCLTPNSIGTDAIGGESAKFTLHIPATASLKQNEPVRIVYHSNAVESGSIRVAWTAQWSTIYNEAVTDYTKEKKYPMEQIIGNLKSSTTYKIDAYGTVDLTGDDTYVEMCLGTVIVTTPEYPDISGTASGSTSGGSSNIHPIYFRITLSGDDVGEGPNRPRYAVSQAGSTSTDPDTGEKFQGSVHVALYTNPIGNPNDVNEFVCEGDIKLKLAGDGTAIADTADGFVTLDNFPGNPKLTSFNDQYRVHIIEAYDSTSHKNVIPVSSAVDYTTAIGVTYPDPGSLSLSVDPITILNYNKKTGDPLPGEYENYDPTTVLGFELTPVGLERNINYFKYIEFYVYDAQYFAKNMLPTINKLKSSNPPAGTAYSRVSAHSAGTDGDCFYPTDDTHYMAKVKLKIQNDTNGEAMDEANAIFLFEDFRYDKTGCENHLIYTNTSIHTGHTVTADVTHSVNEELENDATGGRFFRGRDYEFTFRLVSNPIVMHEEKYYPEVLGSDKECILRCPTTLLAPYEAPTYYFYPADSDRETLTYGYYIKTVDAAKIFGGKGFTSSQSRTDVWTTNDDNIIDVNKDAKVKISSLQRNQQVVVTLQEDLYVTDYKREKTVTAFTRLFTSINNAPAGSFNARTDLSTDARSRVEFDIKFDTAEMAKSVAAIEGTFQKKEGSKLIGTPKPILLKILTNSGTDMLAYVPYSELSSIGSNGDTINVKLKVYYDTGTEGFLPNPSYTNSLGEATNLVCIREAGENNEGQYIIQQGDGGSDFLNRNLTQQELKAQDSIFIMTRNNSGVGAQLFDIAGTLTGDNAKPGLLSVQFSNWRGGSWYYDTTANSRSKLGGVYDARITKSALPFTVSRISSVEGLTAEGQDGIEDQFTLGAVKPTINLHPATGTGNRISAGRQDALVEFVIAGVQGAIKNDGSGMYGFSQDGPTYGKIFLLPYKVVGSGYIPVMEGDRQRRIEVDLTNCVDGVKGDGEYRRTITGLEANCHYAIQTVYYEDETKYNQDTGPETHYLRQYLPDATDMERDPPGIYYHFYTTESIQVAQDVMAVSYKAKGYLDKSLEITYALSASSPQLKPDEEFIYALYDKDGNLVLTHKELEGHITPGSGFSATLDVNAGSVKIGTKNDEDVFLNFEGKDEPGDVRNYKLRLIPMKSQDVNRYSLAPDENPELMCHGDAFESKYNTWISNYSAGVDRGENEGHGVYVNFSDLKNLAQPFYNIRAYSGQKLVKFRISIVDADGIIYNNNYMVRAYKKNGSTLEDCTPLQYVNSILSSQNSQTVIVPCDNDEEEIVLKVYAVEDYTNTSADKPITFYTNTFGGNTEQNNIDGGKYNMKYSSEKSTGPSGFSAGYVEAVRQSTSNSAYIDFLNPTSVGLVDKMHIDLEFPNGTIRSFADFDNPFAESNTKMTKITAGDDTTYRFEGLPDGVFNVTGQYKIAIRMTIKYDNTQGQQTETLDRLINFTVA
ncbi:MAG: collagen-like protein [Lachnospiraceae bacterium]|nr:collagen-like protein [Lachnospiraceae bacterium]